MIQFNIGGKLVPFGDTDYKEFINSIVPPRNEAEFKFYGPSLETLGEKGTIGIFLYDVVTATDAAGNATQKQNYEWYYSYSMQEANDTGIIKKERGIMDAVSFHQIMSQQSRVNSTH